MRNLQLEMLHLLPYSIIYLFCSVNLHARHNSGFIISVDVHVARSTGWRKNLLNSRTEYFAVALCK